MYTKWAERKGWKVEVVEESPTDKGGFDKVVFEVHGNGAYSQLKFEGGVHRVQRVPKTEAQGRIHTSAATVAVMPEADPSRLSSSPRHRDQRRQRRKVLVARASTRPTPPSASRTSRRACR